MRVHTQDGTGEGEDNETTGGEGTRTREVAETDRAGERDEVRGRERGGESENSQTA